LIDGYYYFTKCNGVDKIYAARSTSLINPGPFACVYTFPAGQWNSKECWGPAALFKWTDGSFYIYYCADDGNNRNHRVGVLKADTCDALGSYTDLSASGPINTGGQWAIAAHPFQDFQDNWYLVWSGWRWNYPSGFPQVTYIARMTNPWTIGDRVEISVPTESWETSVAAIQEGHFVVERNGKLYMFYSGNASWTDEYCIGGLVYSGGDILSPASWTKLPGPLMKKTTQVFGPGGPSLTTSRDGTEWWLMYHTNNWSGSGWSERSISLKNIFWLGNGNPYLGDPIPFGIVVIGPSESPPLQSSFVEGPYGIPGVIEAERYNHGGEGSSYHDNDDFNHGCAFRPSEGVDIANYPGGGYSVFWIDTGEWLNYDITVAQTNLYKIGFRYTTPFDGRSCHLKIGEQNITGSIALPNTGGWDNWETAFISNVSIPSGQHILKFVAEIDGINLDYIIFECLDTNADISGPNGKPDCKVDLFDFALLASAWLTSDSNPEFCPVCDINDPINGVIDIFDIQAVVNDWLKEPY
jgi:GH43 family beta-xylosidase